MPHNKTNRHRETQHKSTKPSPGGARYANVSIATKKDTTRHNVKHPEKHKSTQSLMNQRT